MCLLNNESDRKLDLFMIILMLVAFNIVPIRTYTI